MRLGDDGEVDVPADAFLSTCHRPGNTDVKAISKNICNSRTTLLLKHVKSEKIFEPVKALTFCHVSFEIRDIETLSKQLSVKYTTLL